MYHLAVRITLTISAIVLLPIGAILMLEPQILFSSSGYTLDRTPALLSDIRAPAAVLILTGLFALAGTFRAALSYPALAVSAAVFLAYGAGRLVSIALDGPPPSSLATALVFELILGVLCAGLWLRRQSGHAHQSLKTA